MAGVNMQGDEGTEMKTEAVPAIGGAEYRASIGLPADVPVVASAHLTDGNRAEGVNYPEVAQMDVTTRPYPEGTDVGEASNPLKA